jgi:hypothetical protein
VSIWSNRLNTGNKLSDMQWENMSKYAYNWYRTNLDMMERWFGPYVTAHEFNDVTSREYEKHVLPSGRSEKEAGKRGRLASRGSRWDLGVIRASVLTQNKVLSSINESKIMHLKDLLIDKGVGVEKFELTWIAEWMNQLADMPETVGKVKNYPGTTSQSFLISYLQALRIVKSNIAQRQGQTNDVAISIKAVKNLFS